MHEVIDWLARVEKMAEDFYRDAARRFESDDELCAFLTDLADDESEHFRFIERISEFLGKGDTGVMFDITIDGKTRSRLEQPIRESIKSLRKGVLDENEILPQIVRTEHSEWNDIFLYVLNVMKEVGREFQITAASIQAHKDRIEDFLAPRPGGEKLLKSMRRLEPLWKDRILIVDDNAAIRELLRAILSEYGDVSVTENGGRALQLLRESYFSVIVSDVHMPVMNGFVLYGEASKFDEGLKDRFLFITGVPSPVAKAFFEENNVSSLMKPFGISEMRKAVAEILGSSSGK